MSEPIHIKFCMYTAQCEMALKGHPLNIARATGITWKHAEAVPVADAWVFYECENIPNPLPPFLSVIEEKRKKQPIPNIEEIVAQRILDRASVGRKKYGVGLERTDINLAGWMRHLQEELLDAANYIERALYGLQGPEGSKTSKYWDINTRERYDKLLSTGMFFEIYPELTGIWEEDCKVIGGQVKP